MDVAYDPANGGRLSTKRFTALLAISAAAAVVSCEGKRDSVPAKSVAAPPVQRPAPAPRDEIDPKTLKRFQPSATAKATPAPDPTKVALGRAMFYDTRLSRNGETACSSCHTLDRAGMPDGQRLSKGADGQRCVRGSSVVSKSATPDQRAVLATMQGISAYTELFAKAFPDEHRPMTLKNVAEAIAAFERSLGTESRWDRYVRGESGALTTAEKRGLKAFLDAGCQSCHSGPELGGTMFQKLGAVIPWPDQPAPKSQKSAKSPPAEKLVKVPSLKVATLYARYFRDSTSTKLNESIKKMGYHQLGIQLSDEDIAAIAVWMQALTGKLDPAHVAPPGSPSKTNVANLP